jgi:hypothetical protein
MEMSGGQVPPPPGGGQYGAGQPAYQQPQQQAVDVVQRAVRTPETKPFYLTSEFLVYLFTVIGVAIAGASVGGSDNDELGASLVWTLITIIGLAYIVSRGISKAGTKYRRGQDGPGGY